MTVVAVATWRGLGASASALLLAAGAAAQGTRSWLVEADPAGGVLAARAPSLRAGSGLEQVAFSTTGAGALDDLEGASRRLGQVSVVTGSFEPFRAWSTVASPRLDWIAALRRLEGVVVVDVGSLRGGAAPTAKVLEIADVVVLVTTPEPASLGATVAWMDARGRVAPGLAGLSADTSRLLVVDAPVAAGEAFTSSVATEVGDRFAGWWPWEPKVLDHLHRGGSLDHRAVRRSTLPRAVAASVASLRARRSGPEAAA
ncbi:hypothetical protein [Ilumatobacter sp.]|uniref:hypothetical protein n=1 Tax=Ilumatobacter sp. TaxID=1967498 RepID=UPI003B529430